MATSPEQRVFDSHDICAVIVERLLDSNLLDAGKTFCAFSRVNKATRLATEAAKSKMEARCLSTFKIQNTFKFDRSWRANVKMYPPVCFFWLIGMPGSARYSTGVSRETLDCLARLIGANFDANRRKWLHPLDPPRKYIITFKLETDFFRNSADGAAFDKHHTVIKNMFKQDREFRRFKEKVRINAQPCRLNHALRYFSASRESEKNKMSWWGD